MRRISLREATNRELQGDEGSGSYTKRNSGFCFSEKKGTLSAKRLP